MRKTIVALAWTLAITASQYTATQHAHAGEDELFSRVRVGSVFSSPATPAGPASPAVPATPASPAGPASPADPATPASPADPASPAGPATPASPETPRTSQPTASPSNGSTADDLVGRWSAARSKQEAFALLLSRDGAFVLVYVRGGKQIRSTGKFTLSGQSLVLRTKSLTLSGAFRRLSDKQFQFQPKNSASPLTFNRAS